MATKTTARRTSDAVKRPAPDKFGRRRRPRSRLGRGRRLDPTIPNQPPHAVAASPPRPRR